MCLKSLATDFFKDMIFHGHEFFRTISDNCFSVTFISGSKNYKSHDSFHFIFSISIKFFSWLWGVAFSNFLKNYDKEIVEKFQLFFFFVWNHLPLIFPLWKALINFQEPGNKWMSVELTCYVKTIIVFWIILRLLL